MPNDDKPVSHAVGLAMRLWREEAGKRQDELAMVARLHGLNWTQATVAALEGGRRDLAVGELLLLPAVISELVGQNVELAHLFPVGEWVRLGPHASLTGGAVKLIVSGRSGEVPLKEVDSPTARRLQRAVADWSERSARMSDATEQVWPGATGAQVGDAEREAGGLVERRAAQRLHTTPVAVAVAARRLWGHSLTDERERRVEGRAASGGVQSRTAVAGHVTRALLKELRPVVEGQVPLSDAERAEQPWRRRLRFANGTLMEEAFDRRQHHRQEED